MLFGKCGAIQLTESNLNSIDLSLRVCHTQQYKSSLVFPNWSNCSAGSLVITRISGLRLEPIQKKSFVLLFKQHNTLQQQFILFLQGFY